MIWAILPCWMRNGIKALDLLAVDPTKTAWLIEVKNYRDHVRTKPSELSDEVARKVFDTLAALPPARLYAVDRAEQHMASALLRVHQYRVVLQLAACPQGYRVLARSADGGIEAIQHDHLPWEGWMWHPERETPFRAADGQRLQSVLG